MESIIIKLIDLIVFFVANPLKRDFEVGKFLKKVGLLKLEANFDSKFIQSIIEFGKDKVNHEFIIVLKDKELRKLFQLEITKNNLDEFKKKAEFLLHKRLAIENITLDKSYKEIINDFISNFEKIDKQTESKALLDFINETREQMLEQKEINYKNSFDYKIDKYKKHLVNSFKNKYIKEELYVDLNGITKVPKILRFPAKKIEKGEHKDESFVDLDAMEEKDYDPIDSYLDIWLANDKKNFLIILGEYGTGKTTLCQYIAYNMARSNLEHSNSTKILDPQKRIPIIFNLRNFKSQELEDFITSELRRNVSEANFSDFNEYLKNNEFVLIFDGFDEMSAGVSSTRKKTNFEYLFRLSEKCEKIKIILTSRIEYFPSLEKQCAVLKEEDASIDTIYLKLFETNQILKFIKRMSGKPENNWKKIEKIKGLDDLARRPILLNIIVKHFNKILKDAKERDEDVKSIDVFRAAIEVELKEIDRKKVFDDMDNDLGANENTRMEILQRICVSLFVKNELIIPILDIAEFIKNHEIFESKTPAQRERYLELFHTFTFFIRERDKHFRISHKAFADYLAAKELYKEIQTENIVYFDKQQTSPEINHFISEMKPDRYTLKKMITEESELTEKSKWQKSNAVNIILKMDNPKYNKSADFNKDEIDLRRSNLLNISLLQEMKKLTKVNLSGNQISDFTPLQELTNLTELDLSYIHISNIEPLIKMENLTKVNLSGNQISDFTPLLELTDLTELDLSYIHISNIEPLIKMEHLAELFLLDSQISDITPLQELEKLTVLDLRWNKISDIEPLKELKKLTYLNLIRNPLKKSQIEELRKALPDTHISF